MQPPSLSDAVAPERTRQVESLGIRLQVHEWGDPKATPILLYHGMFDHSRGFDLLAPRLAGHLRVVAFDARGHGDSGWAESYAWDQDVADVVNVLRSIGEPSFLLGHSKGGGQVIDAAIAFPEEVLAIVNLDGFGPPPEGFDHPRRRELLEKTIPERFAQYLDTRRTASENRAWRAYPSFDDLVARRGSQNPRLTGDWLRYFVFHAAREDDDGWRWKVDPHAAGGFGPWRPEWIGDTYSYLTVPMLAVIGSVPDTWGPLPEPVLADRLSGVERLERATVEDTGHFIHMEQPERTADLVLDYVNRHGARTRGAKRQANPRRTAEPRQTAELRQTAEPRQSAEPMRGALETETLHHGRVALALHTLKRETGPKLLLLHALHGSSADWGDASLAWPGEVYALDFSGHGESDWLPGRGYAPEVFVAETDLVIARLESAGPVYVAGAGVGAYVAFLVAGARGDRVAAALLLPGEGLHGGGALPEETGEEAGAQWRQEVSAAPRAPGEPSPDPLVRRCTRDIRPAYYAEEFARAAPRLLIGDVTDEPAWLTVARDHGTVQPAPSDAANAVGALATA